MPIEKERDKKHFPRCSICMACTHTRPSTSKRKPLNMSLSQDLVNAVKATGTSISAVAEVVPNDVERDARIDAWAEENKAGFAALNKFIEEEGLPLADLRLW